MSLSLVRSTRDGKLYDPSFDKRMTGEGPYAWMIGRRFEVAAARLGFSQHASAHRSLRAAAPAPPQSSSSLF